MVDARHGPGIKCSIRQKKNLENIETFEKIRKKRKNKIVGKRPTFLHVPEKTGLQELDVPDFIDLSHWRR